MKNKQKVKGKYKGLVLPFSLFVASVLIVLGGLIALILKLKYNLF